MSAIRADIQALESNLQTTQAVQGYAGVDLMTSGMEEMRIVLYDDLNRARRHELDIIIAGVPIADHESSNRCVGSIVQKPPRVGIFDSAGVDRQSDRTRSNPRAASRGSSIQFCGSVPGLVRRSAEGAGRWS